MAACDNQLYINISESQQLQQFTIVMYKKSQSASYQILKSSVHPHISLQKERNTISERKRKRVTVSDFMVSDFLFFSPVREIGSCFFSNTAFRFQIYSIQIFLSLVEHHYLTDHHWRNRMSVLPVRLSKTSPCFLQRETMHFRELKERWLLLILKDTKLDTLSPHLSHTTAECEKHSSSLCTASELAAEDVKDLVV